MSGDLIEWADIVFVMEKAHKSKVNSKYDKLLKHTPVVCLAIADNYVYMQPELISLLIQKVSLHIHLEG
ncbi:hypothetical protein [Flavobacterium sp. W21_SRS_FM6]|uniref:hypothetical protein n=1 Tax=Flavobacterium sp. W21_SRS_FM6 TaxID=3240268 RepID=UPI003F8EF60C